MTNHISPAWILAIRFTCAALILSVIFLKKRRLYFDRAHVVGGLACGLALFTAYYLQTVGITDTTPGTNAFLTSVYCVIVPFLAWAFSKKRPNRFNIIAAILCITGVGFISLHDGFSIGFGDALTLCCAFFFALHIVLVARFSKGCDIYVLTMWQFVAVGVGCWIIALGFEPMPQWGLIEPYTWISLAYLTIFATTIALLFQNIGQAHLPPSSAALLLSTEAVFGVAFSVLAGAENLTIGTVIGFVLVFSGILVSEVLPEKLKERADTAATQAR